MGKYKLLQLVGLRISSEIKQEVVLTFIWVCGGGQGAYVCRSDGSLLEELVLFLCRMGLRNQTQASDLASRVLTCWYQESLPAEPSFWPKLEELIKIKAFLLAVSLLDLMLERNKPGSSGKAARALSPGLSLLLLTNAFSYTGADAARGPDRKLNLLPLPLCFLDEYGRTFPRMYVAFVEEFPW